MPGFDKTGPMGQGPLTGRRRGRCRDTETTGNQNQPDENKDVVYGVGQGGRPRGGGKGNCHGGGNNRGRGYGRRGNG